MEPAKQERGDSQWSALERRRFLSYCRELWAGRYHLNFDLWGLVDDARQTADPTLVFAAAVVGCVRSSIIGELGPAERLFEVATESKMTADLSWWEPADMVLLAAYHNCHGIFLENGLHYEEALSRFETASTIAIGAQALDAASIFWINYANVSTHMGRLNEAIDGVELLAAWGHRPGPRWPHHELMLARLALIDRDPEGAFKLLDQVEVDAPLRDPYVRQRKWLLTAWATAMQGDATAMRRAAKSFVDLDAIERIDARLVAVRLAIQLGDFQAARTLLDDIDIDFIHRGHELNILILEAQLAIANGYGEQAEQLLGSISWDGSPVVLQVAAAEAAEMAAVQRQDFKTACAAVETQIDLCANGRRSPGLGMVDQQLRNLFEVLIERRLESVSGQRRELLAIVAHDIRNALSVARTAVEVLRESSSRTEIDWAVEAIRSCTRSVEAVLGGLSALEVIADTAARVEDPLVVRARMDVIVKRFGPAASRRQQRVRLQCEVHDEHLLVPPAVSDIVIGNLVSNALKYSPDGSDVDVSAVVDVDQSGGRWVTVTVSDEGNGMTEAQIEAAFGRYQRVIETSSGRDGLGLGLHISRQLVDRSGGDIGVKSVVGEGSIFSVKFHSSRAVAGPPPIPFAPTPTSAVR